MDQSDLSVSRRDLIKVGTAALAALNVEAASEPVKFGLIGAGSRGITLLNHLVNSNAGQCVAACDANAAALDEAAGVIKTSPKKYSDYHQLLADKNVEAVFIATPLYLHFPMIRDALQAGKHVFCEASLVFKPEEVHDLRTLVKDHAKQTLQVGLERRYSVYFASVKKMIDDGLLGDVTHIHGQWHQNPGWLMQPGGKDNPINWRLFREFSGGLTSELAAHHLDTANWFFSAEPQFVTGVGGLDSRKDGRDVWDNIQLIYNYPNGRKLIYSAVTTSQHLPMLSSQRLECGVVVMGTSGAVELTFGTGSQLPTALWFREAQPKLGIPILTPETDVNWKNDSFWRRESKIARDWLLAKGIMTSEETHHPIDAELAGFFSDVRSGSRPKADVEVGLRNSTAVILSNLAMQENRRVYWNEIEKIGLPQPVVVSPPPPASTAPAEKPLTPPTDPA